jgi:hypothetical protein
MLFFGNIPLLANNNNSRIEYSDSKSLSFVFVEAVAEQLLFLFFVDDLELTAELLALF